MGAEARASGASDSPPACNDCYDMLALLLCCDKNPVSLNPKALNPSGSQRAGRKPHCIAFHPEGRSQCQDPPFESPQGLGAQGLG